MTSAFLLRLEMGLEPVESKGRSVRSRSPIDGFL